MVKKERLLFTQIEKTKKKVFASSGVRTRASWVAAHYTSHYAMAHYLICEV